jgi:SAM-dependent methyltransferase
MDLDEILVIIGHPFGELVRDRRRRADPATRNRAPGYGDVGCVPSRAGGLRSSSVFSPPTADHTHDKRRREHPDLATSRQNSDFVQCCNRNDAWRRETYSTSCREVSPMMGMNIGYALAYRFGLTPWERYGRTAAARIGALLDREEAERPRPLGRALDLGCGRGQKTHELARRGWEAVGIDNIRRAIDAANRSVSGATFMVGDVTDLARTDLGTFDFFLDAGCFQGLSSEQRIAEGRGISALAHPGATLLMLAFGPTRMRSVVGGVSRMDVETAFPGWETVSAEPADTTGLGWPLTKTAPMWYRLRRRD